MKKIKTIEVPAKKSYTKKVEIFVCDICGKESKDRKKFLVCSSCGRLVCRYYSASAKCSNFDPYECGDYPDRFCSICWQLKFKKYKKEKDIVEENYNNSIEELEAKIRKESLAKKSVKDL